jgi:O-antigen biosynthesis protein
MLGGTLCVALSYMLRARIEPKFDTAPARLLVMFLAFAQPLVRGWNRYFTWLDFKHTPPGVVGRHEKLAASRPGRGNLRRRNYWSEQGIERNALLKSIFGLLEEEGWSYSPDTGWKEWDIQIYGSFFWSVILQTVTEYHGGLKCLTRVRLRYRFVTTTVILNLLFLAIIIYRNLNSAGVDLRLLMAYGVFLLFLGTRARRLKRRVAEILDVAACRAGLLPIRKGKIAHAVR